MSSEDAPAVRNSSVSATAPARSSGSRSRQQQQQQQQQQTGPQQLSTIEKSVTHLLVATKQLLETLTHWSRAEATEAEVSDVYVRLGYEFNIACRAFNSIGVDTGDLGPVPDLLRSILEETLSQEASQQSLDRFLPRIRDIIINLLHGLKKKQQRLRQRTGSGSGAIITAQSSRAPSVASTAGFSDASTLVGNDDNPARQSGSRVYSQRVASGDQGPDLPPRSASVQGGRSSPRKDGFSPSSSLHRAREPSRDTFGSDSSSLSSNAAQSIPVITPYPQEDVMPAQPVPPPHETPYINEPPRTHYSEDTLPPPPPPPKQQDALAALQRGGELERRASRRFSAYQIQKHLGTPNGIPMIPPAQNSPVPNRGRDTRESMNAVRTRSIYQQHGRTKSGNRTAAESPRKERPADRKISEEPTEHRANDDVESPMLKTPEDKLAAYPFPTIEARTSDGMAATVNGPMVDPIIDDTESPMGTNGIRRHQSSLSRDSSKRQAMQQSTSQPQFMPESSPQPGKELTLFLQYKSKIKKFVLADGGDLSIPRLQLAFIEKFAWNTHNNGNDLPEIYLQDPVSGVRHELEDLSDIKDRAVLILNVEQLDEVKRHFDDGMSDIKRMIEGLKTSVDDQQTALHRVTEKQQEAAKEIAGLAAAPRAGLTSVKQPSGSQTALSNKDAATQLSEVQSLRRDLAVVRQTYTSFVDDINASMSSIRTKASSVKTAADKASVPSMNANSGRSYVNTGKQNLSDDSEKLVTRVDDLQDTVEDLRKDVVTRGVRPLPRQLDTVSKDISAATSGLKKLQEFLKREKPVWTKIWERELQVVCDDRDLLTMQEELCVDLEDDLEKAAATFALVEQATRQQHLQNAPNGSKLPTRNLNPVSFEKSADPLKAKDGVLGEVRALQPNHESRLEAIERAERARKKELESRQGGEFQKELGNFVEEGKLKKTGGADEVERLRKQKDERIRKEVWERQQERAAKLAEKERAEAAAAAAAAAIAAGEPAPETTSIEAQSAPVPVPAEAPVEASAEEPSEQSAEQTVTESVVEPGIDSASTSEPPATGTEAVDPAIEQGKPDFSVPAPGPSIEDIVGESSPEPAFADAREQPPTPAAE